MSSGWQGDPRAGAAATTSAGGWGGDPRAGRGGGGGGSSGDWGKPLKKKKKGGGWLGAAKTWSGAQLVENLGKDLAQTTVGVFPGLYEVGKAIVNPAYQDIRHGPSSKQAYKARNQQAQLLKSVADQYVQTYGPLAHGDVGKFASNVYQHPLGPVLDIATVLDLGATAGVKLGAIQGGRGAELVTRSPRAAVTGKGPLQKELAAAKPLRRGVQQARQRSIQKPQLAPIQRLRGEQIQPLREQTRYGKGIASEARHHALQRLAPYGDYALRAQRLNSDELAAMAIRSYGVHPDDLAELWHGTPSGKVLSQVRDKVLNPTRRMKKLEPESVRLSKQGEALYTASGRLTGDTAAASPLLKRQRASEQLGRRVRPLPGGPEPYYVPDVIEAPKNVSVLNAAGGGKGVPKELGSTKQNLSHLFLNGRLHLRSDILGSEFLKRVKLLKYDEIHNGLRRGAVRVTREQLRQHGLPPGWEYLRTKPYKYQHTVSAEPPGQMTLFGPGKTRTETVRVGGPTVPPTLRPEGTASINDLVRAPQDMSEAELRDHFATNDPKLAHTAGDSYYIIPKRLTKAATGEFTRSSGATRAFVEKPLTVWRSLVLGLRPGFLTNNYVGNSLMYAVRTGGQGALRDLFASIYEEHGAKVAKRIADDMSTPPEVRQTIYNEFFPEQTRQGTFGATQSPATSLTGRAATRGGRAYKATTSAIPNLSSRFAETTYRRALLRNVIRKSPEFRAAWREMPKQTRTFEDAARNLLTGKGGRQYQRLISKQVDDALGNYLQMSDFERGVLRNTLPFYSWYRAITRATYTLARDAPLRASILGKLGQIGKQRTDETLGQLPSFLQGAIGLGPGRNGTVRALSTQGLNPWATLGQLWQAPTDIQALGLNPFLSGALKTAQAAGRGKLTPQNLVVPTLRDIIMGLPPVTVAHPLPPSRLYPTRDRPLTLSGFLGLPVKEYDPAVARARASQ